MSELNHLNLKYLKDQFNLTRFIETGSGHGNALCVAHDWGCSPILSCEIHAHKITFAQQACPEAIIENKISTDFLECVLSQNSDIPTFFWLDAHFSWDGGLENLGHNTPLLDELNVIKKYKCSNSVIVSDDMRVFSTDIPEKFQIKHYSIQDLIDTMTYHNHQIINNDVLIFTPKI